MLRSPSVIISQFDPDGGNQFYGTVIKLELFKGLCYFFLKRVTSIPETVLIKANAFSFDQEGDGSLGR